MYAKAIATEQKYVAASKTNDKIVNPGVLSIFQYFIKGLEKLNDNIIESETIRIRDSSKCADYFDDLIKAAIKCHIILLTYNASYTSSGENCRLVLEKYHEKINIKSLIHKCYLECGKIFYTHSSLFWHKYKSNEIQHNQSVILQLIRVGILKAIRGTLPMKEILREFLTNDYKADQTTQNSVKKSNIYKILDSSLDNEEDNNIQDHDVNQPISNINNVNELNDDRPSVLLSEQQLYSNHLSDKAFFNSSNTKIGGVNSGDQGDQANHDAVGGGSNSHEVNNTNTNKNATSDDSHDDMTNNFSESSETSKEEIIKFTGNRKNKNDNIILDAIEKSQFIKGGNNIDKELTKIINN